MVNSEASFVPTTQIPIDWFVTNGANTLISLKHKTTGIGLKTLFLRSSACFKIGKVLLVFTAPFLVRGIPFTSIIFRPSCYLLSLMYPVLLSVRLNHLRSRPAPSVLSILPTGLAPGL